MGFSELPGATGNLRLWRHHWESITKVAIGLAFIAFSFIPANGSDTVNFGTVTLRYEKTAGPVQIVGRYPDAKVLMNGEVVAQDDSSDSIWIVAAFPDWQSPTLVVIHFSPGGNACAGTYAVLDLRTSRLTEQFGNCTEPAVREGSDSLIFAFADRPSESGWIYQNGQLTKISTLREEQHVEIGVAAYKSKNYSKALQHLWLVRESHFSDAPYYLGLMANYGRGVRRDYALALSLYKQAAEIGSPEALFRIGALFANGQGVPRNYAEAMRWYNRAAELGDGLAQYSLGLGYLSGNGVSKDPKRALFWMLIAEERLTGPTLSKSLQTNISTAESQLDEESRKVAHSDAAIWKPAPLASEANPGELKAWVGKYPTDRVQGLTFLEHPEVQILINGALGSDAVSQMRNMTVVSSIEESSGWLIASGCQPHMCVDGQWLVAINLANLQIRGCLARVDSSSVRFGASGRSYVDLPRGGEKGCPTPQEALVEFDRLFIAPVAAATNGIQAANEKTFVSLQRAGGTYVVPVLINNAITLKFVIDSGAADVSIPADVFLTLVRTGTLQNNDFIGTQTYTLADGSIAPSATFRIRSLMVGNLVIENVTASIAPAAGPLLLGQSFLSRFNSWSIDNAREALVLGSKSLSNTAFGH